MSGLCRCPQASINWLHCTNIIVPHFSFAETVVRCCVPSQPCTPVELAQPVETEPTETGVTGLPAPGCL